MSQVIELSLDDLGCIVIPNTLQQFLGLLPGMMLVVEPESNGNLRLRIQSANSVVINKRGLKIARVQPLIDLTNITQFEREYRVTELLQRVGWS